MSERQVAPPSGRPGAAWTRGEGQRSGDGAAGVRPAWYRRGVRVDAIVVLGCRFGEDGVPSEAAARRVARAAQAFGAQVAPRVVCSGGRRWGPVVEAVALREALVALGVPRSSAILELASLTTSENARFTAELLAPQGFSSVAVVTCDWHLPRAQQSFRAFGFQVHPLPAPSPPAPPLARARRRLHEVCSSWLDARMIAQARPRQGASW